MRDALRRLSEGFRDRLKRFDSTHDTGKYVRVYMCYLFVLTLFFSRSLSTFFSLSLSLSPSLLLFFHIQQRRQKRPLVYVLRIITSSPSLPLVRFFSLFNIPFILIGGSTTTFSLVDSLATHFEKREEKKAKGSMLLIKDCKSTVTEIFFLHMGDN